MPIKKILNLVCALSLFVACSSRSQNELKIAATSVPHAEILEFIKPDLEAQGIFLNILVTDDYSMPNRALSEGEVDANFFQHLPFMESQIEQFSYSILSVAKIEIEPMGVYSKKIHSLQELKENAKVAIPSDPSNQTRALLLLQELGMIGFESSKPTVLNIKSNPKHLRLIEADAAMLSCCLQDVDIAVINTNYALQAGLSPLKDALALESKDSDYANILTVRQGDENSLKIQALKEALTSEKLKEFILRKYKGSVSPAF